VVRRMIESSWDNVNRKCVVVKGAIESKLDTEM
jgi:hypothetical protein